MRKTHQTPEFTVIRQNQANAKFFVASGGDAGGFTGDSTGGPDNSASHYGNGASIDM